MRTILYTTVKDAEKFDGGKWFTKETLSLAIDRFFSLGKNKQFLCKGNGTSGIQTNSICIDKSNIIGRIIEIFPDRIIVDLNENKIPSKLLDLILDGIFKVDMRCIITDIDTRTNEILNLIILSYDLRIT